MHHIGGRDGYFPVGLPGMFHSDMETYIYDADSDCLDYMHAPGTAMVRNILTETIGGRDGATTFHLNYDPYTSSLRPAGGADWYYEYDEGDYALRDVLRPLEKRTVTAKSLATLRRERGVWFDYLSIDVQGAEGEVLDGLDDDSWRDLLILNTEVSTVQLYAGQALFHEICTKLYGRGFFLAQAPMAHEFNDHHTGLGWRGAGFRVHGDALFFRDISHLSRNASQPALSLYKLSFLVLSMGHVSYALKAAEEAERLGGAETSTAYITLVKAMSALHAKSDELMPPSFSHIWTAERSLARFGPERASRPAAQEVRARYFADVGEDRYWRLISRLLDPAPTDFERLLEDHGLTAVASEVSRRRLQGAQRTAATLDAFPDGRKNPLTGDSAAIPPA
jgi:FkbM family methyltransferase